LTRDPRSAAAALALALLVAGGCASVPPAPPPLAPEVRAALDLLERRWQGFADLRTLAEVHIRRGDRLQRLTGVLLLRAPASLRFEALSPFGTPVLLAGADSRTVTLWEVADERAFLFPSSREASRRWLGLALDAEDVVGLLAGRPRPLRDPLEAELVPADSLGPSLRLRDARTEQRIWFDPETGQSRQLTLGAGTNRVLVVLPEGPPGAPPAGIQLDGYEGRLEVLVAYRSPQLNSGFDPALLPITVPEHVKIQDFR
jgi:outer membrane lipoprotein-sorting protein